MIGKISLEFVIIFLLAMAIGAIAQASLGGCV